MAENRKERLSLINYKLDFRIPSVYDQKIQGLEELTFNLEGANEDLLLDFRESVDMLKGLIINGKSQEILFENEHIVLLAENSLGLRSENSGIRRTYIQPRGCE